MSQNKSNTYLISSPTINQLAEEITKILGNTPYETIPGTIAPQDLFEELSYSTLFSVKRYIVVKEVDYFGTSKVAKEVLDLIEKYLTQENPDITLIFTTSASVDERKKITKIIKNNGNLIKCPSLTIKDTYQIIKKRLISAKYKIQDEALYYLINSCNNDYDLVINELAKVYIYYGKPCEIMLGDLKEIIASPLGNNNFKLIDAIINHNLKLAFKIYNDLKIQKVEPIIIINLLAREYRLMYLVKTLSPNFSQFEIAKKLSLQNWQVAKYQDNAYHYSNFELIDNLKELANIDYQIKSGKLNKHLALEVFILQNA